MAEMTEDRAMEILNNMEFIAAHGNVLRVSYPYMHIDPEEKEFCFDGHYTIEQIEAALWWMRNKAKEES